jgi:hypothetical protein
MQQKNRCRLFTIALGLALTTLLLGCGSTETADQEPEEKAMERNRLVQLTGTWEGTLNAGGQQLRLVFHLREADGDVTVTMDSPDQGATGVPIPEASFDGDTLSLGAPAMGAGYQGTVNESQTEIDGVWRQGGAELDLVLDRVEPASEATPESQAEPTTQTARPQDPLPPFPYETTEVTFENTSEGITLAGTITFPSGNGPFPGVVLISGSGQQDRNEEIFGHKPFLVIADALTRAGFAVLRYDDRGVGESGGRETLAAATTEDFAYDALAAYRHLSEQSFVAADQIGLLGHSEGGVIAPIVATELRSDGGDGASSGGTVRSALELPAFYILMGAPGVPGDELLIMQSKALLRARGATEAQIDAAERVNREVYDLLLSDRPTEEIRGDVRAMLEQAGLPEEQVAAQLGALLSPWYRSFLRYDPAPTLREVEAPVLAVIGELDRQVPPEENLPKLREALEAAPTETFTVQELSGLNHLLQPAQTGGVEEYSQIETTVAPEALELIMEWAVRQVE